MLRLARLTSHISPRTNICPLRLQQHVRAMASTSTSHYAALILGSGQAGTPLASALAASGQRTCLIESTHIGGTCVNVGCTPTKTMVASARVAYLARRSRDYGVGIKCGDDAKVAVDMEKVRRRKREIVDSFRGGSERRVTNVENLNVVVGSAKFVGSKEVEVAMSDGSGKRRVSGDKIFINAGCRPAPLNVPGAESVDVLDSTSIMELDVVPGHLVVVGGGYIGVEFAHMFHRFGAKVTIVQRRAYLLPREDKDISDEMKKVLEEDGIEVLLETQLSSIAEGKGPGGSIEISLKSSHPESDTVKHTLKASHILSAAGRIPNTDTLNLTAANITTDTRGYIKVNAFLETSAPDFYALGDIKGGPAFTHISYDDFRILRDNVLHNSSSGKPKRSTANRLVPYTIFTDPQLGRVGLTEASARAQFPDRRIQVAKMPMAWVARALEMDETRGVMKAVVDADSKEILGFACLGIEGGEIMSMVQIAMMGGVGYDRLQDAVFAHPCLSEGLNNLWGNLK